MLTVDEIINQAKRLPPQARRHLRDSLDESLEEENAVPEGPQTDEGPYASFLKSAGSAHALAPDVARNKNKHLAEVSVDKRSAR